MNFTFKIKNVLYLASVNSFVVDGELLEGEIFEGAECYLLDYPKSKLRIDSIPINGTRKENMYSFLTNSLLDNIELENKILVCTTAGATSD